MKLPQDEGLSENKEYRLLVLTQIEGLGGRIDRIERALWAALAASVIALLGIIGVLIGVVLSK